MRRRPSVSLALLLAVSVLAALLSSSATTIAMGTFSATGDLGSVRQSHTATLLPDGRVLLAGGVAPATLASTELYDPATGLFSAGPTMTTPRSGHSATLLADGRVLLVGGFTGSAPTTSVETFDPADDSLSPADALGSGRSSHGATLLVDGRVLVSGGFTGTAGTDSAEIYDPVADSWSATGSMSESREAHSSLRLTDGTVLVATGQGSFPTIRASAEIYDPASGVFTPTGSVNVPRFFHTSTMMPDGTVLLAGGSDDFSTGAPITAVESYDPATGVWTTISALSSARSNHTTSPLPDGSLLVFGGDSAGTIEGYDVDALLPLVELASPISGGRDSHTATVLADGRVLVAGGPGTTSAEIYDLTGGEPGGEPGGSAELPDGIDLATPVIAETVALDGADIEFTDLATSLGVMVPLTVLPFPSPSVTVSLTPVSDLATLAAAAPPPVGGTFVAGGALVFDTFLGSAPSGPFTGSGFLSAAVPLEIDPVDVGVYAFAPGEIGVAQDGPGVPWLEIDPLLITIAEQTLTWPVAGPGLFALVAFAPGEGGQPNTVQLASAASANFWIWTAGEVAAADLLADSDTLINAWHWTGTEFESFNPALPIALTINFTLGAGPAPDVLWIVTSGALVVPAPDGGPAVPDEPVVLAEGAAANFVSWRGAATTASVLFGDIDTVTVVWHWTGDDWEAFNPALPAALTVDFALGGSGQPDLLWLVSSGAVSVSR